jgi:hypothetical protein
MTQNTTPIRGISAESAPQIPAAVREVMDLFGWPEYIARRHLDQRAALRRASYRAPVIVGSAA